jgi:sporulation protein YlmC with PRC-barrel domain
METVQMTAYVLISTALSANCAHGQAPADGPQVGAATQHSGHEFRASKLLGARVDDRGGDELGDVQDIVIAGDGSVVAVILSIGGVLNVGDRLVAVAYDELDVAGDGDIYLPLTAAEIETRPQYAARSLAAVPSAQPPPREPADPATQAAAEREAQESFAGSDPRVAEGIAENKEAFENDGGEGAAADAEQ